MAMGLKDDEQEQLFVTHANLRMSGGHPFYEAVEKILKAQGFGRYVEEGKRLLEAARHAES